MARPNNPAGGRPALAPGERLLVIGALRANEAEAAAIRAAAARAGETVGEYARRVLVRAAKRS
jgi:hypothetical protein